ncbi:hypothetical protein APASM_4207 [Actinosynnema pretiosum subsp. pretiosum]|nr:hypothetical protein APASM_4207 [Actinosynnema pretiosum subsp. pretiosum]
MPAPRAQRGLPVGGRDGGGGGDCGGEGCGEGSAGAAAAAGGAPVKVDAVSRAMSAIGPDLTVGP